MAKKTKPGKLTAVKLAKEMARVQVGPVPPTSLVSDRRHRPQAKHKFDLAKHPESEPRGDRGARE
ncbi:MAG TPA: hypothetical protein VMV31_01705 [Terriglobales bacterium]|nr:hypothetical protein [Terriglobales bacterium]